MRIVNRLARATEGRVIGLKSGTLIKRVLFAVFVLLAGFLLGMKTTNLDVFAQAKSKTIGFFPSRTFLKTQIKIEEVRVGETARVIKEIHDGDLKITSDEKFGDDPNWLSHTSLKVKNVSGKPISYFTIAVRFPETRASGPIMVHSVSFGRRQGLQTNSGNPELFMPNEEMDISLGSEHAKISNFVVKRHSLESINRIELEVSFIVFEDGTAWSGGTFMRMDPSNPNRYLPVVATSPETTP